MPLIQGQESISGLVVVEVVRSHLISQKLVELLDTAEKVEVAMVDKNLKTPPVVKLTLVVEEVVE